MVAQQIAARGIRSPALLEAMRLVPRDRFVPRHLRSSAYDDTPLPIGLGQTISQPWIVASMIDAAGVRPIDRVLEVGAGTGYAASVLGRLAREVWAMERHRLLAEDAAARVRDLGYHNVHIVHGDGTLGLPAQAPFDVIIVSAAGREVPDPLKQQLAVGGRMVMPVGDDPREQVLMLMRRTDAHTFTRRNLAKVHFVPLISGTPDDTPST